MSRIPDSPEDGQIVVRRAAPEDAEALRTIAESSGIDAWTIDQYRSEILSRDVVAFVAAGRGAVLGFILGRVIPGSRDAPEGEIYNIAVVRTSRRNGIGRMLLGEAVDAFRTRGCGTLWLEVRASNLTAAQFYENNGFNRFTQRKRFYSNPVEDAFVMRLPLEKA